MSACDARRKERGKEEERERRRKRGGREIEGGRDGRRKKSWAERDSHARCRDRPCQPGRE